MLWNTTALLGDPYTISYTTVVHDIVQTMDRLAAVLGTLFLRYAISILRLYLDKTHARSAQICYPYVPGAMAYGFSERRVLPDELEI